MWARQRTPDLNNAQRFLRGGTQAHALDTQEDTLQDHSHDVNDPGHTHVFYDNYFGTHEVGFGPGNSYNRKHDSWSATHWDKTDRGTTGISVSSVEIVKNNNRII